MDNNILAVRAILSSWCNILDDICKLPIIDTEDSYRIKAQIKQIRDTVLQAPEESPFDVWKRVVKNVSEGKPVDMVDVHRVNNYMEDQKRLKDGAKNPTQGDNAPAVPRRSQ